MGGLHPSKTCTQIIRFILSSKRERVAGGNFLYILERIAGYQALALLHAALYLSIYT